MRKKFIFLCSMSLCLVMFARLADVPTQPNLFPSRDQQTEPSNQKIEAADTQSVADKMLSQSSRRNEEDLDHEEKRDEVIDLVQKAASFFEQNTLEVSFNAFTHGKEFRVGDLYISVYDYNGVCLAHGQQAHLVWKNMYNFKDSYGALPVQDSIKKAEEGGGWITYNWRDASKRSYVQEVIKNDRSYVIASGYYPHSKEDAVVNLVKGATQHFNESVERGEPVTHAFSTMTYPLGLFVRGDLYLYVIDFEGNVLAHGDRPGLIGTNTWDYKDSQGVYVNREIVKKLKETSQGIWQEYISKNALKVVYAQEVTDKKGKHYFIACGYYPEANRKRVVELVKRGYHFLKRHGKTSATKEFSDKRSAKFRYGDLSLVVHDFEGKIIADGGNADLIGLQAWNFQDQDGKYLVREMINKATAGGGWVSYKLKNSYKISYVEPVEVGLERYVVSSGFYPISKEESMILMVKGAVSLFAADSLEDALQKIVDPNGSFIRGDLSVYVIDPHGIVLAWGDNEEVVWRNMMGARDDEGRPFVRMLINSAKRGPAKLPFTTHGKKRIAYAEEIEKDGRKFIVGSSYFT